MLQLHINSGHVESVNLCLMRGVHVPQRLQRVADRVVWRRALNHWASHKMSRVLSMPCLSPVILQHPS